MLRALAINPRPCIASDIGQYTTGVRMEQPWRLPAANSLCHLRRVVDEVVWVKMTVHQRLAKSHGYYLQHAKEVHMSGRLEGDLFNKSAEQ